jgi:TonB family protein
MKKSALKQRILGCLSFSLITHLSLIAAAFVLPGFASQSSEAAKASAPTVSSSTVIATDAPAAVVQAPTEVVEAPPAVEAQPVAAEPVAQPKLVASVRALPAKHTSMIPTSLPEKHSKMIKDTENQADANLKQALSQSRQNEKASLPEMGGDIPTSVVAQNDLPQQLQPDATFPEESGAAAHAAPVAPVAAVEAAPAQMAPRLQIGQPRASQAIAPIQKSGQLGSTAPTAGSIRNADDIKEMSGNIKPVYPVDDRRAGRQGTVIFVARLTPEGQIMNVRIEKSSASASLDNAAYSAFRSYRYQSGQQGLIRKAFTFALKGEAIEAPVARR